MDNQRCHVNPFVHRMSLSSRQKVQIFIMSFTLAPIRFFFAFSTLLVTWVMGYVFTLGASSDFTVPVSSFRQKLYNFLRKMGSLVGFFCGIHFQVSGVRSSAAEAPILIGCPHSSYLDIMYWFIGGDLPAAMSKQENLRLPIFGTLFKAVQPVFVQRTDTKSRAKALNMLKERVTSPGKWPQVLLFPEGTCTNKSSLISFKRGAFTVGVPVQPIAVRWEVPFDYVTWTEISSGAIKLIWIMLCQFRTTLKVDYLPVYKPNEDEVNDASLYAENVRKTYASHFGVPTSEYSYEDRQLMRCAKKINFPQEHAAVEFLHAKKLYGVDLAFALDVLKEFSKVVKKGCFEATKEDFLNNYEDVKLDGLQNKDVFDIMFSEQKTKLSFREFFYAYCSLREDL